MKEKNTSIRYSKGDQIKNIANNLNKLNKQKPNNSSRRFYSEDEIKEIYEIVIDSLSEMLVDLEVGEKLIIPRFMTITKDRREAKMGRNPKKPEDKYMIDSYDTLSIKQSQILKKRIKEK